MALKQITQFAKDTHGKLGPRCERPDDACAEKRPGDSDTPPHTEGAPESPGEKVPREPDSDAALTKAFKATYDWRAVRAAANSAI